jgi:hypothetical protein
VVTAGGKVLQAVAQAKGIVTVGSTVAPQAIASHTVASPTAGSTGEKP